MAGFEILFKESVWKDLKKVPKNHLKRILSRIEKLKDNPRPTAAKNLPARNSTVFDRGSIVLSFQSKIMN
jgi:mRNA interferase RelE/StbE